MKKMKKLASLLLVLVMSLALAVPAFATARESTVETKSNRIYPSGAGYNYEAYSDVDVSAASMEEAQAMVAASLD